VSGVPSWRQILFSGTTRHFSPRKEQIRLPDAFYLCEQQYSTFERYRP
jgi:hypothetical protein